MFDISQFDLKKTLSLVKGSLLDHPATAESYRQEDPGWDQTLINLTVPVILAAVILSAILSWVFDSFSMFSMAGGFGMFLRMLVWAVLGLFIFAFATAFLAGTFGGTNNFNRGFALVSLVAVVGYTGSVLGTLPWVGWILSLALAIYALVLFYRDIPVFLDVPQDKRVVHIIATIVVVVIVNIVISLAMGGGMTADRFGQSDRVGQYGSDSANELPAFTNNLLGITHEQTARALQDTYDPPEDGEVSNSQVREMIGFLEDAREIQKDLAKELEEVSEKEIAGIGDVMAGFRGVADIQTAEMKVVKDGGGNWAEHQWVKQQLAIAGSRHDQDQPTGDNYELFKKYEDELMELLFPMY
jgi:hypothetical protein